MPTEIDIIKTALAHRDVRVVKGTLWVSGKGLKPEIMDGIRHNKAELVAYYSQPELLQRELDEISARIEANDKNGEDSSDLWRRYYILLGERYENMDKPWITRVEDKQRCPTCPHLGEPARDGILCDCKCES